MYKIFLSIVLVCALAVGLGFYFLQPHTFLTSAEHTALNDAFATNDTVGALTAAKVAVQKYPDSSAAYVGLAFAYAQSVSAGTTADGLVGETTAEKAITLDPQNPDGYRALGYVYEVEGKYPQSIGAYSKGLSVAANHPLLLSYRAHAEWASGDIVSAQTDYEHALAVDPKLTHAQLNTPYVYASLGTPDALTKAATLLHAVILSNANPKDIEQAQSFLGTIDLLQGDFVLAEKDFTLALSKNPTSVRDELGLAWAQFYQLPEGTLSVTDAAVTTLMTHIRAVQAREPHSSSSFHLLGLLEYRLGDKVKGDAALASAKTEAAFDPALSASGVIAMRAVADAALVAATSKK
jgi:tetratricopeptide (TPR) repeat protein